MAKSILKFCILIIIIASCTKKEERKQTISSFSGVQMDIPYRVLVGTPLNEQQTKRIHAIIESTFNQLDLTFNKNNPDSEVSHFNQLDAFVSTPISVELAEIIQTSDQIVSITEGRFDPTIEPALKLWQEHLSVGCKPPTNELEKASIAVGWQHVHYSNGQLWKENQNTQLDLGGIATGLGVDVLTDRLCDAGFKNILVEWGGKIRAAGRNPDGKPWTVSVRRASQLDLVPLENQALATSNEAKKCWMVGGVTYSHMLDPSTCCPLELESNNIDSVTVIAPTCTMADALATSALLFQDSESAHKWAKDIMDRHADISFWITLK